jgi:hypothetical protein
MFTINLFHCAITFLLARPVPSRFATMLFTYLAASLIPLGAAIAAPQQNYDFVGRDYLT